MKRATTVALVAALIGLLFIPPVTRAQEPANPPQPKIVSYICGIVVIGVGAVVVWNLWKFCKKVLPPTEPGGATNAPPAVSQIAPSTHINSAIVLDDAAVQYQDITAQNLIDPVSKLPFTVRLDCALWTSTDAQNWSVQYRISGWGSDTGILFLFSDAAGNPVLTNYCASAVVSAVPLDLGTGKEPARFFKITAP